MVEKRKIWPVLFGVTIALTFMYLSHNFEVFFGVAPDPEKSEVVTVLAVFGGTFGYFLAEAVSKGDDASYFVTAFAVTMIVAYLTLFAVKEGLTVLITELDLIALGLPALTFFAGGMWFSNYRWSRFKEALDEFFSKIAWYIFGLHILYVYEFPLLQSFLSKILSPDLETSMPLGIVTASLVAYFVVIHFYVESRKTR